MLIALQIWEHAIFIRRPDESIHHRYLHIWRNTNRPTRLFPLIVSSKVYNPCVLLTNSVCVCEKKRDYRDGFKWSCVDISLHPITTLGLWFLPMFNGTTHSLIDKKTLTLWTTSQTWTEITCLTFKESLNLKTQVAWGSRFKAQKMSGGKRKMRDVNHITVKKRNVTNVIYPLWTSLVSWKRITKINQHP